MPEYHSCLNLTPDQWADRVAAANRLLSPCTLCPRECRVDRLAGETGFCHGGVRARVASTGPHFGEEAPLVGHGGSGTIFFSGCNLGCIFCQNYDISHHLAGNEVTPQRLAGLMVSLQQRGCHNINLVTPTHFLPQILQAIHNAIPLGLRLPIVYNCGGYESVAALRLLDGVVDIYMPDAKFLDAAVARRLCQAPDYPERMQAAIREMHRQVGPLQVRPDGIARRGLLVRHLVMPEGQSTTPAVMQFLASVDPDIYVNVMDQYHPCYRADEVPEIARRLTREEYAAALNAARRAGLRRLDRG
ncbi:MAG: radical SAM protein [Armatimonadetes bacterium]|nr:radical SAM protein [Armatimonadota bacterium]